MPGPLKFGYHYPGLYLGAVFFFGLTALMILSAWSVTGPVPNPPPAGQPGEPVTPWPFLVAGGVCVALGGGLVGLGFRLGERFIVTDEGVVWKRGGRRPVLLRWAAVRRVRLSDAFGRMIVEGPPDTPPVVMSTRYEQFDEVLDLMQGGMDWQAVTAAPGAAMHLPIVQRRTRSFWIGAAVTLIAAGVAVGFWFIPVDPDEGPGREVIVRVGPTAFFGMLVVGLLRGWKRLRIDATGVELRSLFDTRFHPWSEFRTVHVRLEGSQGENYARYDHIVSLGRATGEPIVLRFGDRSYAVRDAILAAAAARGVVLRTTVSATEP
ncbi:MAG TPA: PH domain-containing protein, partial [Gemmataceae bacterium]|nr:PH domain-containing protein [Gemmataceae bacterium]